MFNSVIQSQSHEAGRAKLIQSQLLASPEQYLMGIKPEFSWLFFSFFLWLCIILVSLHASSIAPSASLINIFFLPVSPKAELSALFFSNNTLSFGKDHPFFHREAKDSQSCGLTRSSLQSKNPAFQSRLDLICSLSKRHVSSAQLHPDC